ncbi:hypothetical protein E3N88_32931 [Mikania micrantha]|uniref:Uncharacterized protein n=1 Tax=Mikania micrantha TaxID=192012 RepID=A0A5N6MB39_9ASTR|nr:hypothetical protein E3N88_32931 [Mikania micrantha]
MLSSTTAIVIDIFLFAQRINDDHATLKNRGYPLKKGSKTSKQVQDNENQNPNFSNVYCLPSLNRALLETHTFNIPFTMSETKAPSFMEATNRPPSNTTSANSTTTIKKPVSFMRPIGEQPDKKAPSVSTADQRANST